MSPFCHFQDSPFTHGRINRPKSIFVIRLAHKKLFLFFTTAEFFFFFFLEGACGGSVSIFFLEKINRQFT